MFFLKEKNQKEKQGSIWFPFRPIMVGFQQCLSPCHQDGSGTMSQEELCAVLKAFNPEASVLRMRYFCETKPIRLVRPMHKKKTCKMIDIDMHVI